MGEMSPDLGALYMEHREVMFRVAVSVLRAAGRESEATEVVSEAIESIISSQPRGIKNWQAFLVTVTKRKALDRLGSAEVRHGGGQFDEADDRGRSVYLDEEVANAIDRTTLARECLSVLNERDRYILWQTVAVERSRDEVAAELGVSPPRISQIKKKALEVIRAEMARREERDNEC